MKSKLLLIAAVVIGGLASGCASYYKVTDPNTKAVYYTEKYDRQQSGVIVFKDAKTGSEVTLPASHIDKISKEQYDAGRYAEAPPQAKAPS